jgi:hypothetical protein
MALHISSDNAHTIGIVLGAYCTPLYKHVASAQHEEEFRMVDPFKCIRSPPWRATRRAEHQYFLLNETPGNGGQQIAPSEEEAMLRARIDRMLDTIVCPPSYGAWQAKKDRYIRDFHYKDPRSAAEDAEHAQLTARVLAFSRTPEGRARDRIAVLGWKRFESLETLRNGLRPADQSELDHLMMLYPDLPLDPDNLMDQILIKRNEYEAKKRALEAEAQKHAQEDEPE